jgi:uncharacterized membrane protein YkoI
VISEDEAVEAARRELASMSIDPGEREVEVTRKGSYSVVFKLPEGLLGGDWTVEVDAETGETISAEIQR